jgi:hypothetical protein
MSKPKSALSSKLRDTMCEIFFNMIRSAGGLNVSSEIGATILFVAVS